MPLAYRLHKLIWLLLDEIYPPVCGGCGRLGLRWCESCQSKVTRLDENRICRTCGNPMGASGICRRCRENPPSYDRLRSFGVFDGVLREALHRLKYKNDVGLGEPLAGYLTRVYRELGWAVDVVVPVPLGRKRHRARGYNQSHFIARPFAWQVAAAYREGCLVRTRNTRSQVDLNQEQRRENVEGAFAALPQAVSGKNVLLIDDVATTGATIGACAAALKDSGAKSVYGLTVARAI